MQAGDLSPNHQDTLAELTRMGMDIARALHARVTGPAPDAPEAAGQDAATVQQHAAAFERIARCVRRTVLLAHHLAQARPDAGPDAGSATRPDPVLRARRQVLRAMEDAIAREREPLENPEILRRELLERLDGPDLVADLATCPVADIVQDMCRDMGLDRWPCAVPFPRRTPADIARLLAQADGTAPPGDTVPWTRTPWPTRKR